MLVKLLHKIPGNLHKNDINDLEYVAQTNFKMKSKWLIYTHMSGADPQNLYGRWLPIVNYTGAKGVAG